MTTATIQTLFANTFTLGYTGSQGATASVFQPANRAVLIGDSSMGDVLNLPSQPSISTAAGSFVVYQGTATIVCSANHNLLGPGQYVHLFNTYDTLFSHNLNGVWVQVLSVPNPTTFTVSATYNGLLTADGDYTLIGSPAGGWSCNTLMNTTYGSWFKWLQMYNGNPFRLVAVHAVNSTTSAASVALLPKILAGPAFDYAFVQCGTFDIVTNTTATSITSTNVAVVNIQTICQQLLAYGARVILGIPPSVGYLFNQTVNSNLAYRTAFTYMRQALLQFVMRTPGVTAFDLYRNTTDNTGYIRSDIYDPVTPGLLVTAYGLIAAVSNESARLAPIFDPLASITPVSILDDSATYSYSNGPILYPNLLANGMMSGTGGGFNFTIPGNASGTAPTGWTVNCISTTTCAAASSSTRVVGNNQNTNAVGWGYEFVASIGWQADSNNEAYNGQSVQLSTTNIAVAAINNNILAAGSNSGIWLKAGFTVRATDPANQLAGTLCVSGQLVLTITGSYAGTVSYSWGNSTYPYSNYSNLHNGDQFILNLGDVLDIWSDEIFLPYGTVISSAVFNINILGLDVYSSSAPCTDSLAFSSIFLRQVQNPYA